MGKPRPRPWPGYRGSLAVPERLDEAHVARRMGGFWG